ncbi:CidA/LrgA family protein [Rhodoblastus sp.]|uniref:CidA/LrgA family protein n=1 Tax=Rhodoblastus sp. TaxID=1962975 RepID=UPI003F96FB50
MTSRELTVSFRRGVHRSSLAQIGLIVVFWFIGETSVRLTGLPLPGGMVGLALALVLLANNRISLFSMRRGAQWFLAEMILFFVPAVLAIIDHREFLGLLGLKILIVIFVGTATVMGVTALTVDFCYRWRSRHVHVDHAVG